MIMGLGGHWVYQSSGGLTFIANKRRRVPPIEACNPALAYSKTSLYLANRIKRDRLMLSYAKKKGHSINSKKGRKPRIAFVTFDSRYLPVAVTLGRSSSRRYLDGVPLGKRYRPLKKVRR